MATVAAPVQLNPNVRDFLGKPRRMLIGGQWVESVSGKTFPTVDPATGETLVQVAQGERADIDRAVKAAREAFETGPWPEMPPAERSRLLWKLSDLVEQHKEELAELETLDNGKPVFFSRLLDVPATIDMFRYFAGWATKIEGTTVPISRPDAKYFAYTLREPVGVVGQIIPWNFPLIMASWKSGLRWQRVHRHSQACRTDAADGAAFRRASAPMRFPRRRSQHRHRFRRDRRRCSGGPCRR